VLILVAAAFITTVTNKLLYYFAAFTNPFERHASFESCRKLVIPSPPQVWKCIRQSLIAFGKALLHGFHVESVPSFCPISCQSVVLRAQQLPGLFNVSRRSACFLLIGIVLLYDNHRQSLSDRPCVVPKTIIQNSA